MAEMSISKQAPEKGKRGLKRRSVPLDEEDDIPTRVVNKTRCKRGAALAVQKPSYALQLDSGRPNLHPERESLRSWNRHKLRIILNRLLRQQDWVGACGALSALLKASYRETSIRRNRRKYWAALELLHHVKDDQLTSKQVLDVFDLRVKKVGPQKARPVKERFVIQCELIALRLQQGELEAARRSVEDLMQERGFESHPLSTFLIGMTYFCLWYAGLPDNMRLGDMSRPGSPMQLVVNQDEKQSVESIEDFTPLLGKISKLSLGCDSSTSVGNEKENIITSVKPERAVPVDSCVKVKIEESNSISARRQEDEETSSDIHDDERPENSIFYTPGLPPRLLPLQLPNSTEVVEEFIYMHRKSLNEDYKMALTYLSSAVDMESPAYGAFHPLIQILLAGDNVKEALDEAEKLNSSLCTVHELRLKSSLLEHFNRSDNSKLIELTEDILKRDPTCNHSVANLIDFHQSGYYSTEKLVEMIGNHLDATCASCITWEVFASCLLSLSRGEEDQFSTCTDGNEDRKINISTYRTPAIFSNHISRGTWQLRCRWWKTRHYSRKMRESEIAKGDVQLLTYKAAVAAHLYGRDYCYIGRACEHLGKEKMVDLLSVLRMHTSKCVGFFGTKK